MFQGRLTLFVLFFFLSVAFKTASLTGVVWLLIIIFIHFVLPDKPSFILQNIFGMLFIILPIMCHIKIYFAIRRQNKQVQDAMEDYQQLSIIFKREKKVAVDMFIVIIALLICLGPVMVMHVVFRPFFPQLFGLFYTWVFTPVYLNSCINPVLYVIRKKELRRAFSICVQWTRHFVFCKKLCFIKLKTKHCVNHRLCYQL